MRSSPTFVLAISFELSALMSLQKKIVAARSLLIRCSFARQQSYWLPQVLTDPRMSMTTSYVMCYIMPAQC